MKKQRPASLIELLTQLVRQTRDFYQWTKQQMTGTAAQPVQPAAGVERESESSSAIEPKEAEKTTVVPEARGEARVVNEEKAELPVRAAAEQPAALEERGGVEEEFRTGSGTEYRNRIDAARGRVAGAPGGDEELQGLLEQAVGLLETLSAHPAIRDYGETKRKLEEIEQRLGYGSYPQ